MQSAIRFQKDEIGMVAAYFYDQLHERTKAVSANRITPWIWLGRLKKFFRFGYVF